jgi:hypothetical protein
MALVRFNSCNPVILRKMYRIGKNETVSNSQQERVFTHLPMVSLPTQDEEKELDTLWTLNLLIPRTSFDLKTS